MSAFSAGGVSHRVSDASWARWRSLRYFALSRVVVAAVLLAYLPMLHGYSSMAAMTESPGPLAVAAVYLIMAIAFAFASRPGRLHLHTLAQLQVSLDLIVLTLLLDSSTGLRGGLATLLILPNAGAAILLGARQGLFFSAVSAMLLITVAGLRWLWGEVDNAAIAQAGLIGAALMATVLVVNWLAVRLETQERLAEQRGEDLRNQLAVTQAVIGELPDGVAVLDAAGQLRTLNRSARKMLGGPNDSLPGLALLQSALAAGSSSAAGEGVEFSLPGPSGAERRIRARRLQDGETGTDSVVILEDLGRLERRAQQLKLASMGRLSASIAHEIRNPLSAIRHANGLLGESLEASRLKRLSAIVEDNCLRIDRVIEGVLSVARRGPGTPELIRADAFIAEVVAASLAQSGADPARVARVVNCEAPIWFDPGNLRQVLVNLLGNALRHASDQAGAVRIEWTDQGDQCVLVVSDDGPGVPEASLQHLFEPFFTTDARGTGLGLHLARELCTANGATIRYRPPGDNPRQRSAFIVEPKPVPLRT